MKFFLEINQFAPKAAKWIIAICLGLCTSVFLAAYLTSTRLKIVFASMTWLFFFVVCMGIIFSGLIYIVLFQKMLPRLAAYCQSRRSVYLCLAITILCGVGLVFAIPLERPSPSVAGPNTLKIIATGKKNPQAKANEVWLTSVSKGNDQAIDFSELIQDGNWQEKENSLAAFKVFPSKLIYDDTLPIFGGEAQELRVSFVSHPWSGKVRIVWNNTTQEIDLYSDPGGTKTISLKPVPSRSSPFLWVYVIAAGATLGMVLFLLFGFLVTYGSDGGEELASKVQLYRNSAVSVHISWYSFLGLLLIPFIIWFIFLLAFWPGMLSTDSIVQWEQFTTGKFNDWHPALHTLTMFLISRIWNSPAAIAIVQEILLALLVAGGCLLLYKGRTQLPFAAAILLALIFAVSPINMVMVNTLWKDVLYSIAVFGLSLLILYIVMNDGAWLSRKYSGIVLGLVATLISFWRHNGFPVAMITLAVLLVVYRYNWRQLVIGMVICSGFYFGFRHAVYDWFDVETDTGWSDILLTYQVAAHIAADTPLTPAEKDVLNQIRPLNDRWGYNCNLMNLTFFDQKFNWPQFFKSRAELRAIFVDTLLRDPMVNLRHVLCADSLVWAIKTLPGSYVYTTPIYWNDGDFHYIEMNELGIKEASVLPNFKHFLYWNYLEPVLNTSKIVAQIIWRPAIYLYAMIFFTIILAMRLRSWKYLLYMIPGLLQSGILLVVNVAQDFRYQYSVYLLGLFSIGFLFVALSGMNQKAIEVYKNARYFIKRAAKRGSEIWKIIYTR